MQIYDIFIIAVTV